MARLCAAGIRLQPVGYAQAPGFISMREMRRSVKLRRLVLMTHRQQQ